MQFFRAKTKEQFMEIAQTNPAIAEAWEVIQVLSADERVRALAEAREKARMDYEDNYDGAYREGEQKGRQEGRQEGLYIAARNALRKRMSHDDVADLTGLSIEEVQRIASDRNPQTFATQGRR
jgi:predicted transposase/invertase (TIGR01784 family)